MFDLLPRRFGVLDRNLNIRPSPWASATRQKLLGGLFDRTTLKDALSFAL